MTGLAVLTVVAAILQAKVADRRYYRSCYLPSTAALDGYLLVSGVAPPMGRWEDWRDGDGRQRSLGS